MPMQMGQRFNFEKIDIEKLRRNLRVKAPGRRKRGQESSIDIKVDEPQLESDNKHDLGGQDGAPAASISRRSSPTIRTFNSQNLLPVTNNDMNNNNRVASPAPRVMSSASTLRAPSSLPRDYDPNAPLPPLPHAKPKLGIPLRPATASHVETLTSPGAFSHSSGEWSNFDLRPPPPNRTANTLDGLSDLLYSEGHLRTILQDPTLSRRFAKFLKRHQPHSARILARYWETQKAIKAVEYANAIAEMIPQLPGDLQGAIPVEAATLDARFKERSSAALEALLTAALPAFITNGVVKIVTESMIKEVTGQQAPVMRDLLGGLAEVFCITDPSIKDNPIVYASEEFYHTTQYGRDYVIGRNSRFLQGPGTNQHSVARIRQAMREEKEVCETILNYRRDGTAFFNLLMTAPLYDNQGQVRYFLGAQVDISGLIEEGRGLESFDRYLVNRRVRHQKEMDGGNRLTCASDVSHGPDDGDHSLLNSEERAAKKLKELGDMFSLEESAIVSSRSIGNYLPQGDDGASMKRPHTSHRHRPGTRLLIAEDSGSDNEDEEPDDPWALNSAFLSGGLPGVYQNYFLVRPYPSLRIIFVSPALDRVPGLLQSSFLSHIGQPSSVRDGLADAFASGVAVTARISWIANPFSNKSKSNPTSKSRQSKPRGNSTHTTRPVSPPYPPTTATTTTTTTTTTNFTTDTDPTTVTTHNHPAGSDISSVTGRDRAQTRWISCTPLLGSDDRVGVWMVVMVEKPSPSPAHHTTSNPPITLTNTHHPHHPHHHHDDHAHPHTPTSNLDPDPNPNPNPDPTPRLLDVSTIIPPSATLSSIGVDNNNAMMVADASGADAGVRGARGANTIDTDDIITFPDGARAAPTHDQTGMITVNVDDASRLIVEKNGGEGSGSGSGLGLGLGF